MPTLEKVHEMVGNKPELTQWIKNASIFSLNHNKLDKSYAKRLWRLSKNLNFLYDKKFWSFCYEHRDGLQSYLDNSFETTNQQQNSHQKGDPFDLESYLSRFEENMQEYNKIVDLVHVSENVGLREFD